MSYVLLISVGGSPDPVIHVMKDKRPSKVLFFASRESRSQVEEKILPGIGYIPACGFVVTPDAENVGICAFELLRAVPDEMRKLGEESAWPTLVAYTGGTKTMSAALVWAASRYPCELLYVGGMRRSKEGLGVVESGTEHLISTQNPWNQTAWYETELARELFNRAQYRNAAELIGSVRRRVTDPDSARPLEWLHNAFCAFHAWDIFDHKGAGRLSGVLRDAGFIHRLDAGALPGLHSFCKQTEICLPFLKSIESGTLSRAMALDLLANAKRRARQEGKYEDAVARCYSAVEKLAKLQLKKRYDIDNAAARAEQIPESLRDDYFRKFMTESGTMKFGFKASFQLLNALGDAMGAAWMEDEKVNGDLLGQRNKSILGHGIEPAGEDEFNAFFDLALRLAGIGERDLICFPCFPADVR